ncbi:MAG: efflux RND transporter permease subunit [Acidimicrobiia bacterium]
MMRSIVVWSTRAPRLVVAAAVVLMGVGVWQLRDADVDVLPEFSPPTVEVQIEALGLSAEEVEQLITVPMEQDLLDGVAWLDTIQSRSVPGLSSITMVFEPGTDLYRARQVVQERISQAAGLPQVSKPPQMLQPTSSTARMAMISLSSTELSPLQIGVLARWTIRPRLMAVPGVANVAIWGQRERQLQVQVDPAKLRDTGVSLEQIISSAGNALWVSPLTFLEASSPGTGGFIDTPSQRIGIQHNLPIIAPADLAQIPIDDATDSSLTLGDVATVVEDHQPLIGDAVITGPNAGLAGFMVVIDKLPYANTAEVTKGVEEALDALRPGLDGLDMDSTIFRPATYTAKSVDNLTRTVLVASVLLLLALLALLSSWRSALVALVSIVLSLLVAALVIHLTGRTFNVVVLAGLTLALGAIVHDAIVNVDETARRLAADDTAAARAPSRLRIVRRASLEAGRAGAWATVMLAVALVPIALMDGLSGDSFYQPMAAASIVAVAVSLVVATTVTPALCVLLLSRAPGRQQSQVVGWLHRGYDRALARALRTPAPAFAAVGVLALAAGFVVPRLDKALLPPLKDTNLMIHWDAPFGTSLPEMDRITSRAAEELRVVPGVLDVGAQVGQATLGDAPVGADSAEMWVSVDPSADYARTLNAVRDVVDGYPGIRHEVTTYSKDKMSRVLAQTTDEITVRLFGTDLDLLHQKAEEVRGAVAGLDGVSRADVASAPAEPTMEISVDLVKAKAAGVKPGDVRRAAVTLLSGLRVGSLFENQKVFDVVVWSTPESRHSTSSVQDLLIDTPNGGHMRLGDVADVRVRATSPSIQHEDISRFVDVTVDVSGRDLGSVTSDVKDQLAQVDFPLEYHAELLDDFSQQRDAQWRLVAFAIAATIGIFLLLQAAFGSWRLAIIAFATLTVALAGGAVAAWLDGGTATLASVAGLLALLALTQRSCVLLLGHARRLRTEEGMQLGVDLVTRAARESMPPIVMTISTTALVLLPAIAFGDVAGQEIVEPMAWVIVGGMVTSAIATLFVLPALYLRYAPQEEPVPLDFGPGPYEPELAIVPAGAS